MKYTVIFGYDGGEFKKLVNKMIKDGWEPLGGISATSDDTGVLFAQAMIKRDKE